MLSSDIAIDFGTSTIRIFLAGKGIAVSEPSLIAVHGDTGEILAMGRPAAAMRGRVPENIKLIHPFVGGLVESYALADYMFTSYIKKIGMGRLFLPSAVISVPVGITEVERHAISDVVEHSGIRKIEFLEETVAAALGAGINLKSAVGSMVIDIGEVSCAMAVIAGNQVVSQKRVNVAGQDFDAALTRYLRRKHSLEIGPQSAREAKEDIGCVFPREKINSCHIKGRNLETGLPGEAIVTSDEMVEAFAEPALRIAKAAEECLEPVPPEILGDIARGQITLTGGGAYLYGMDMYLQKRLKLPVIPCEEAEKATVKGAAKRI